MEIGVGNYFCHRPNELRHIAGEPEDGKNYLIVILNSTFIYVKERDCS